jgi:lipocalin
MLSTTKIRTSIIALVATASFAVAAVAPAVSQAQWHTYCVSGHCITHANFTSGDPCVGITANYNKAYEGLLEAIQTKKEQADKVQPEMTQAEAQAKIEEAEAQVHLDSIAAFEWGCSVAVHTAPTSVVVAPVGAVQASPVGSILPTVQATMASSSPAPAL